MKKLSLMAAGALLFVGLVAYAATSGNGNNPPDCCKKTCTTKVFKTLKGDSTSCNLSCDPKDCKPVK